MQLFSFNKIYSKVENNSLNLYFVNTQTYKILHFNEFDFKIISNSSVLLNLCNLLDYRPLNLEDNLSIISIRESESVYFIKMNNGDIFQIFFMFDDENAPQQVSIFNEQMIPLTPLGLTLYEAANKRFEEAEEFDINII